ncbi:MAG: 4-hydroxythreonine-4-phosphate dehydrogenase PdxA [Deltaproteobacteria bacterium]|nr:4-hydroxythreonine-4-phosphate dehydrogenase PdxA [Deltaproteobacteria bacterium]
MADFSEPGALALSLGCPAGIGPEVALRAAAAAPELRCLLIGDEGLIRATARRCRVAARRLVVVEDPAGVAQLAQGMIGIWAASTRLVRAPRPGAPDRHAGAAQLGWIDEATDLVSRRICQALVTGPVSKAVIAASGARGAARFRGHTEHLARRLGAREVIMAFHAARFTTALVTTHLSMRRVPAAITPVRVASSCYWLARLLGDLGAPRPRIAVAALNPHAGEAELLGDEERLAIVPGMTAARRRLGGARRRAELCGPIGAETAFREAAGGRYDGVVAMYHDQGTIPCKLLDFGSSVNVTLGLPIIRTSVDHGTAYDRAGTGRASHRGMAAALVLAQRLASANR